MERTDLGTVMQEVIAKFNTNRIGDKPRVFVTLSPDVTQVPWRNDTLKNFVRTFLYESLLTSNPDTAIQVSLRRRFALGDLSAFLGTEEPSYWLQLQVSGRGLRIGEPMIEELFDEVGYRREEWVGVEGSSARLGVFGAIDTPTHKIVFCLESSRHVFKCDLLLPVIDSSPNPNQEALAYRRHHGPSHSHQPLSGPIGSPAARVSFLERKIDFGELRLAKTDGKKLLRNSWDPGI